jgi:hypothetical protein
MPPATAWPSALTQAWAAQRSSPAWDARPSHCPANCSEPRQVSPTRARHRPFERRSSTNSANRSRSCAATGSDEASEALSEVPKELSVGVVPPPRSARRSPTKEPTRWGVASPMPPSPLGSLPRSRIPEARRPPRMGWPFTALAERGQSSTTIRNLEGAQNSSGDSIWSAPWILPSLVTELAARYSGL